MSDHKPPDCTCDYPEVRVRNMCGHPQDCAYYARWYKETFGEKKEGPMTGWEKAYEENKKTIAKVSCSECKANSERVAELERAQRYEPPPLDELDGLACHD